MFIVYSILAVLLIGQLICTIYLVTKYSSSPEKQWKNKVLSSLENIQTAQKREQHSYDTMSRSQRIEVERLESQAINRLLQQMPVSMLADYPGIGPSTVEKLQYAGFSTVFDVHTRGINIHGIGDKRLSDINQAQNQLCQQVLAKIKNANSIEYQQLAQATKAINEAYSEKTLISEARLHAIRKVHELARLRLRPLEV